MDDADWLIENLVHWYGMRVSKEVFDDYLNTYIELSKPSLTPMLLYKLIATRQRSKMFKSRANELGIVVG